MPYVYASGILTGTPIASQAWQNSCYDIDYTNAGHQPRGFDQWKEWYGAHKVHGIKFTTTIVNVSTTVPFFCGYLLSNEGTFPYLSLTDTLEDPTCNYWEVGVQGSGAERVRFNNYWQPRDNVGATKEEYEADDQFSGTSAANPSTTVRIWFWAYSVDRVSTVSSYMTQNLKVYTSLFVNLEPDQS